MDQLLPYFMMRILGDTPGLPGLFVSGIFSGALSSVSSFVNSLAAVTIEDYIKPLRKTSMSPSTESLVTRCLALFFGLLCVALTYLAEQMTGILQASLTIFGVVGGPLLALFTMGMCTKRITSGGALAGFVTSLAIGFWVGFGTLRSAPPPAALPLSTDGCPARAWNDTTLTTPWPSTTTTIAPEVDAYVFPLYKMSYMYYAFFTWAIAIVVAAAISCIWRQQQPVDDKLIAPPFRGQPDAAAYHNCATLELSAVKAKNNDNELQHESEFSSKL